MSKLPLRSLFAIYLGISPAAFGQHILVCRGTDQVLIGSSAVFQMEEGKTYPVIGISANGNLMFFTPLGGADFHGDRFRVVDGGQYANVEVALQEETKVTEHWQENKMGYRSKYSRYTVDWTGQLQVSGVQPVGQCYVALQWYSGGQPVATVAKVLGTLDPQRIVSVSLKLLIGEGEKQGSHSVHVWSGPSELKVNQVAKPEW